MLFVGIGGSGGKSLRFLYNQILRRLDDADVAIDGMPECFQFISFDLPEKFDGYVDKFVPPVVSLDAEVYTHLADQPLQYRFYDDRLTKSQDILEAVYFWRPRPVGDIPPPYWGAGQRRSVGRAVAVCSLDRVADAVKHAADRLNGPDAQAHLTLLDRTFHGQSADGGTAFVIGSLAGGSGSGIFLDTLDMIRSQAGQTNLPWFKDPQMVFFAADVFDSLGDGARLGVEPNSLAAISEYVAAFQSRGGMCAHEAALHGTALPPPADGGRRSGSNAFVIGKRNGQITFGSDREVYQCTARALACYATTPALQQRFHSEVSNVLGLPSEHALTAMWEGALEQPARSFGFGSAGLGRSLFATYTGQRLARLAVDRLLVGHREGREDDPRPDDVIVREIADREEARFFTQSGLWEVSTDHNMVLDQLRDESELKVKIEALKRKIVDQTGEYKVTGPASLALGAFQVAVAKVLAGPGDDPNNRGAEAEVAEERQRRGRAFVTDLEAKLLDLTVRTIARFGLPVARELLERLHQQLDAAFDDLEKERQSKSTKAQMLKDSIGDLVANIRQAIDGTHEVFKAAGEEWRKSFYLKVESDLRKDAADLVREVRDGLLPPLQSAAASFHRTLQTEVEDRTGVGQIVASWARREVPVGMRPAPNEFLVEPYTTFPDTLEELLSGLYEGAAVNDSLGQAVEEVIRGGWTTLADPRERDQDLIAVRSSWIPDVDFRPEGKPPHVGEYTARVRTLDLEDRARSWVRNRSGGVAAYVRGTLHDYLDPNDQHNAARAAAFVSTMSTALASSSPLVAMDDEVLKQIHGEGDVGQPITVMTPIPIASDHPAREPLERQLLNWGVTADDLPSYFDENSRVDVEIMSFMRRSLHPAAMTSVIAPIARAWSSAASNPEEQRQFWRFRRARTLEAFVPLPRSVQGWFIGGWYVANLLGYLRLPERIGAGEPVQVWSPDGWLDFPPRLLGGPVMSSSDVLPALLESVPLGLVALGAGDTAAPRAFGRLIELGNEEDRYPELTAWVASGEFPAGHSSDRPDLPEFLTEALAAAPGAGAGGGTESDAERRQRVVIENLARVRDRYAELERLHPDLRVTDVDHRWEIATLAGSALEHLADHVRSARLEAGPRHKGGIEDR